MFNQINFITIIEKILKIKKIKKSELASFLQVDDDFFYNIKNGRGTLRTETTNNIIFFLNLNNDTIMFLSNNNNYTIKEIEQLTDDEVLSLIK